MGKRPAFKFDPEAWLSDEIAGCSLAAQGLWLRMLFQMHVSDRRGYLSANGTALPPEVIARRCGTDPGTYRALLAELDTAHIPERTAEKVIFNRRMVRESKEQRQAASYGRMGGNPLLMGGDNPPDNAPPPIDSSICITWDLRSGFGGITTEKKSQWVLAFPGVNIEAQVARAHSWLCANPTKRKKNNERFLTNWLGRAQENGRDYASNPIAGPAVKNDYDAITAHLRAKEATKCAPKK